MGILKFLGKCAEAIALVILIVSELLEFLALPAFFVVIGILCQLPVSYYYITIGGYLVILALIQLLLWWLEKKLQRHFDALLTNKLQRITKRLQEK